MSEPAVPLGEIVRIVGGGTPSTSRPEYFRGRIPWVSPKDMKSWDILDSIDHVTEEAIAKSSTTLIARDAVLVVTRSGVLKRTLPVAINRVPVTLNQDIKALICGARVIPDYLARALQAMSPRLLQTVRGTTADNISTDVLMALEIPLPTLPEQLKIAARLEKADRLRRTRRYILELTDEILPAAFLELFGDPQTNPKGWDMCSIEDVVVFSQYGTSQKSNSAKQGYPVLGMGNLTNRGSIDLSTLAYVDLSKHAFEGLALQRGDIIFNRTNSADLVGKTTYWNLDMDAVLASYLVRLQLKPEVLPEFFSALLNTGYFKNLFRDRCKKAVGQSNISPTLLKEFPVYTPRLALQRKFATLVDRVERLRRVDQEALRQAEHLFASLLHDAFSG